MNQTASEKHFQVIPHMGVSEIDVVQFENSKLEILTGDICEALPFLDTYWAESLGLISVDANAFEKCTKLKMIFLDYNSLTTLPSGVFDFNVALTEVYLLGNKLSKIDENLFKNNLNLERISLSYNQLQEFSFSTEMPVMTKLTLIYLKENELTDVGVETLLEKCPYLHRIDLDDNKIACERQQQIIDALKARNTEHVFGKCVESPETLHE